MWQPIRAAIVVLSALTIITGGLYTGMVTLIGQSLFPRQANGSVIREGERIVGSSLIGQSFTQPKYFWSRLSATAPIPYNAAASSGSNYGPLNPALQDAVTGRIAALRDAGNSVEKVPVDLVTASGSGLDPHISPAAAEFQVARVARARNLDESAVRELVRQSTEGRQWGIFGESRVNVLRLNLALDHMKAEQ